MNGATPYSVAPDPAFAARLERLLLADLGDIGLEPEVRDEVDEDVQFLPDGERPPSGRRVLRVATVVLLVAAALAAVMVLATRRETAPQSPVPTTAEPLPSSTVAPTTSTTVPSTTAPSTTISATSTSVAEPARVPFGDLVPGTYRVDNFVVPFTFTVPASWTRNLGNRGAFTLERDGGPVVAVTSGLTALAGTSPDEVLGNTCAGAVEFGPTTDSELLDEPAVVAEGPVSQDCTIILCTSVSVQGCRWVIPAGDTLRALVADVNGSLVTVLVQMREGSTPPSNAEIDALLASMQRT